MPFVPTIAVVDDDQAIREAMDDLIKNFGYNSCLFSSAEEFLDFEPRSEIDCMLVDVKMPGLTGTELLAELNRQGDRPPMIFVTSYDDERTRKAALSGGAFAFLRKPVDVGALIACLEAVFDGRPSV
ncbi:MULTISPECIES: response regulator transcription factor [Rhizobium]|uniref:Response regulator n=1 Tax=Rhizobium bangladeshense TaxID=1138189 RepID=A0ABS7LIE9_9HYPH|nr:MULTISPECIES: response regulator [Rhizobium]MBX4867172.1 response regulator [Rhizobium bangladeshense]MBX4871463.1 response regulator [Rhizobium bangladeshense]MBX4882777.1 response regulator [Rhizobium bangladeshense]MBX4891167.1 response regulator [Rhizobium bangladeshense]MBX4897054.1 response regulator [Rhizobium bangladeshense]